MNEEEQMLATAEARLDELWSLRANFQSGDRKPSEEWMTECISAIGFLIEKLNTMENSADLLVTLALAMWQAGYEAALKLEWMLPEGAGG